MDNFEERNRAKVREMASDEDLRSLTKKWFALSSSYEYSYHFSWMGRPIIQFPQDIIAMQEIIWRVQPDLIIETGIARGGSLIFYASMLELIGGNGQVVGIDIDIRPHNKDEVTKHPMYKRISMIEGSSTDEDIARKAAAFVEGKRCVLVALDSNHTHAHVLRELELYSPLVTKGSYLVVFDTVIQHLPAEFFPDRPWGTDNNPKTAIEEFLKTTDRFEVDTAVDDKLLITVAPGGYLKCIRE